MRTRLVRQVCAAAAALLLLLSGCYTEKPTPAKTVPSATVSPTQAVDATEGASILRFELSPVNGAEGVATTLTYSAPGVAPVTLTNVTLLWAIDLPISPSATSGAYSLHATTGAAEQILCRISIDGVGFAEANGTGTVACDKTL
jgi:hypothetical protein